MVGAGESGATGPSDPQRPRGRSLALNSSAVFIVSIVIQLVGYIPTFFLARGVGLTVAGQTLLGTIQTFLLLATTVSGLGDLRIGSSYTFFVSRGQSPQEATTTYLAIRVVMVAIAGLTLYLLGPSVGVATSAMLPIFAVWVSLPLLWTTSVVYQNLWVSLGDSAKGQYPQLIEVIVRAAALTFVAVRILDTPTHGVETPIATLWVLTYAYVAGAVASSLISIPALVTHWGRFHRPTAVRFFRWSWPLMGSMVLLYLSGNLVSFIVIGLLSKAAFNIFNAANAFRALALALPAAIAIPLFPHISTLHKEEAFSQIRSRTWQTLRFTAILVVPGVLALAVYRVNILNILYSHAYLGASTALAILAVSAIPAALSQIIGTTMTSIGRTRLELYITSLQVACLAIVSALIVEPSKFAWTSDLGFLIHNSVVAGVASLLPAGFAPSAASWTGINGAAIAVLVASFAAFALNAYFLYTLLGVRIQVTPIITILVSSTASFLAISQLNDLLPINRYYQLAAGVILGFAVYLLVLAAVGELSKEDVALIVRSMGLPGSIAQFFSRICWRKESRPVNPLPPNGAAGLVPLEAEWAREERRKPPPSNDGPPTGP